MHDAAPRKKLLALLTPEYVPGLPIFTRNFFREFYSRLPRPGILVLDNYQDIPDASALHELLSVGLDEVPKESRVFVISRADPPPAYSRLVPNQQVVRLCSR